MPRGVRWRRDRAWAILEAMFPLLLGVLAVCAFFGLEPVQHGAHPRWLAVAGCALAALGVLRVLWEWVRRPDGVRDWIEGGVVAVGHDGRTRVEWEDWAIAVTRVGYVDRRAALLLRLERRLLFGLLPLAPVVRPLSDLARVELKVEAREGKQRWPFESERPLVGYTYPVWWAAIQAERHAVAAVERADLPHEHALDDLQQLRGGTAPAGLHALTSFNEPIAAPGVTAPTSSAAARMSFTAP